MQFFSKHDSRPRAAVYRVGVSGALLFLAVAGILAIQPYRAFAGDPDVTPTPTPSDDGSQDGGTAPDVTPEPVPGEPASGGEDGDGVIMTATGGSATPTPTRTPKPPKNHPPVAFPSQFVARKGEAFIGQFRVSDRDKNDVLTYSIVRQPARGTVLRSNDGRFLYTPATSYTGRDRFGFQVSDGKAHSQTRRIEIVYRVFKTPAPTPIPTATPTAAPTVTATPSATPIFAKTLPRSVSPSAGSS